jgi:hypothetical protein
MVVTLVLFGGCADKKPLPSPAPPATGTPSPAAAPGAPASAPAAQAGAGRVLEGQGLRLEFMADGRILFKGKDRWGGALDTTYENASFLSNALPVLTRSLTPPQVEFLSSAVPKPDDAKAGPAGAAPAKAPGAAPAKAPGAAPAKAPGAAPAKVPGKAPGKAPAKAPAE